MSASTYVAENAANTLEIVEQHVSANEWAFGRSPRQVVRLRAAFLLVAGDQRDALHLRVRPQSAGKAAQRAV